MSSEEESHVELHLHHILVEDIKGKKYEIQAFDPELIEIENIRVQLIQRNKNFYVIVISCLNHLEGETKLTHILCRRTVKEIQDLIKDSEFGRIVVSEGNKYTYKSLINQEDDIEIFSEGVQLVQVKFKDLI